MVALSTKEKEMVVIQKKRWLDRGQRITLASVRGPERNILRGIISWLTYKKKKRGGNPVFGNHDSEKKEGPYGEGGGSGIGCSGG